MRSFLRLIRWCIFGPIHNNSTIDGTASLTARIRSCRLHQHKIHHIEPRQSVNKCS
jgi:hypothetical protein